MRALQVLLPLTLASVSLAQDAGTPTPMAPFFWGDFDGDELADALVLDPTGHPRLLHNRGDGTLEDVSVTAGIPSQLPIRFALWQDVDGDADADLFLGTLLGPSRLLTNQGDGTFLEVDAGFAHEGEDLHAAFLDYDRDGLPDLLVRTRTESHLYRNLGGGAFAVVETGRSTLLVPFAPSSAPATVEADAPGEGAATTSPRPDLAPDSGPTAADLVTPTAASGAGEEATETRTPPSPSIDSARALGIVCAQSIEDVASGGCLNASSTPTLGLLYPISENLYVAPAGNVGLGTTTPSSRLEIDGDLRLSDDQDGIRFANASGTTTPMIRMFQNGTSNANRMVVAHSDVYPDWGLQYRDAGDVFAFLGSGDPALEVDLGALKATAADMAVTGVLEASEIDASSQLDLVGGSTQTALRFLPSGPNASTTITLGEDAAGLNASIVRYDGLFNRFELRERAGGSTSSPQFVLEHGTGDVGIGDTNPTGKLDVRSDGLGTSAATIRATNFATTGGIAYYGTTSGSDATAVFTQSGSGPILRGFNGGGSPVFEVRNSGRCVTSALQITGGGDLVEGFDSSGSCEPGTVVVIDARNPGKLLPSKGTYDRTVAGIVSGANGVNHGIRMGQDDVLDGDTLVAMSGRVWVKATDANGTIRPGDLLTTADREGHAMKATDPERAFGAVIGKAMSALDEETGMVLTLVSLQ